jgi:hypothetical protein
MGNLERVGEMRRRMSRVTGAESLTSNCRLWLVNWPRTGTFRGFFSLVPLKAELACGGCGGHQGNCQFLSFCPNCQSPIRSRWNPVSRSANVMYGATIPLTARSHHTSHTLKSLFRVSLPALAGRPARSESRLTDHISHIAQKSAISSSLTQSASLLAAQGSPRQRHTQRIIRRKHATCSWEKRACHHRAFPDDGRVQALFSPKDKTICPSTTHFVVSVVAPSQVVDR